MAKSATTTNNNTTEAKGIKVKLLRNGDCGVELNKTHYAHTGCQKCVSKIPGTALCVNFKYLWHVKRDFKPTKRHYAHTTTTTTIANTITTKAATATTTSTITTAATTANTEAKGIKMKLSEIV